MISLKQILISYQDDLKLPVISNNGWALDIFSPSRFSIQPGCHIHLPAGFGLNLPKGVGGIISPKNSTSSIFSVGPGQLIHPEYDKELTLKLKYEGRTEEMIPIGSPLCQIVLFPLLEIDR